MVEAVKASRKKEMGYKTAAKTFQVPRATLKDYVKSSLEPEDMVNRNIGRPTVLPKVIEQMLAEYCLTTETGLRRDYRILDSNAEITGLNDRVLSVTREHCLEADSALSKATGANNLRC
uniref:HTH psq-type domain-containing protein n=1 Tax=Rhodnius prolixus TaxID=13249 RepID=T1HW54_RHOPR